MNQEQIKQMMNDMKESMKSIATETVNNVLKANDSKLARTTEKMERKRKADKITFNKKGHEDQYRHGKEVEERIDEALEHLEEGDFEKAQEQLKEGKKIIGLRAKHLRIGDREGWLTVEQFRSDELVENDEEEIRLKRPIKSATTLREKMSKKTPKVEHSSLNNYFQKNVQTTDNLIEQREEIWMMLFAIIANDLDITFTIVHFRKNSQRNYRNYLLLKRTDLKKEDNNFELIRL